ncbi:zinc finger domain-containing protein [Bacillus pacificus]
MHRSMNIQRLLLLKQLVETCERCWVVSETIGKDAEHETLCERCATVVKENYVRG